MSATVTTRGGVTDVVVVLFGVPCCAMTALPGVGRSARLRLGSSGWVFRYSQTTSQYSLEVLEEFGSVRVTRTLRREPLLLWEVLPRIVTAGPSAPAQTPVWISPA